MPYPNKTKVCSFLQMFKSKFVNLILFFCSVVKTSQIMFNTYFTLSFTEHFLHFFRKALSKQLPFSLVWKHNYLKAYVFTYCWSKQLYFKLFKTDCGCPDVPTNGSVTTDNGTIFGQFALYSCDTGFDLLGNKTRYCDTNETWSGNVPYCKIKG